MADHADPNDHVIFTRNVIPGSPAASPRTPRIDSFRRYASISSATSKFGAECVSAPEEA
jgi:hypothetical protein